MQALFKARFEQALESQKLNVKKIEQDLRRKGVNPEDPVAMASIQRVASTFFNAIDKKEGTPYVFYGNKQSAMEPLDNSEKEEPSADSDQEELDRFIAEIEDAADKEWAEEEEAEKEELGKIRYWNKESYGDRTRRGEMYRNDGGGRDARSWQDTHSRQRTDRDSRDISGGENQWDSDDVENSDVDNYEDAHNTRPRARRVQERENTAPREYNTRHFSRNTEAKFRREVSDNEAESEDMLSDLDNAMWESDDDEEDNKSRASISEQSRCYMSSIDKEGDAHSRKKNEMSWMDDLETDTDDGGEGLDDLGTSRDTKQKYRNGSSARNAEASRRTTQEDSALYMSSDTDDDMWESGLPKNFEADTEGNYSDGDISKNENYQRKHHGTHERNHKMKTPKDADETWDSD